MTRLLLVFLLTVLPLQMSWAAASAYCLHENGTSARHLGHHDHHHAASSDDKSKTVPLLAVDADCGICQLGHVGIPHAQPGVMPLDALASGFSSLITTLVAAARPERPERPKWARAA